MTVNLSSFYNERCAKKHEPTLHNIGITRTGNNFGRHADAHRTVFQPGEVGLLEQLKTTFTFHGWCVVQNANL